MNMILVYSERIVLFSSENTASGLRWFNLFSWGRETLNPPKKTALRSVLYLKSSISLVFLIITKIFDVLNVFKIKNQLFIADFWTEHENPCFLQYKFKSSH